MGDVIDLNMADLRKGRWEFPDGTVVTIEVPSSEPPITVKHAIYCLSDIIHRTHEAMRS